MTLAELCTRLDGATVVGDGQVEINTVAHDSRDVTQGTLFVALPGRRTDGTRFVEMALRNGAAAIAVSEAVELDCTVPVLRLASPRADLATIAAEVYGRPADGLQMVGVTGTNGKSTVATLVAEICVAAEVVEGLIGTIDHRIAGVIHPAEFTTPEAPILHRTLRQMVAAGVEVAVMEVSSVGLEERRVDGIPFRVAGFLNLTPDHLDYHADMDAYGTAKARLFHEHLALGGTAIIDIDDPYGARLVGELKRARPDLVLWTLSVRNREADICFEALQLNAQGVHGILRTPAGDIEITSPLLGSFNASNVAMATGIAIAVGISGDVAGRALASARVRGRLEPVNVGQDFSVVVDYAHSPDALERVLETLRPITPGLLWCVFGCGGDRDSVKRAPMGRAAAQADAVIVTSDNPRTEDPRHIAEAAMAGVLEAGLTLSDAMGRGQAVIELDRRRAIALTLEAARAGDMVLVAGKGHETYQEIDGVRHPFDDVAVVRELLGAAS